MESKRTRRKLLKNAGGSGGHSYRVSLPIDFVRELDLEDADKVVLSIDGDKIIIEKEESKH